MKVQEIWEDSEGPDFHVTSSSEPAIPVQRVLCNRESELDKEFARVGKVRSGVQKSVRNRAATSSNRMSVDLDKVCL